MADVIKTTLWDKTGINKFGKMLDLTAYRHKLISGNIANATTPNYAARDINFEDEIQKAVGGGSELPMKATNSRHISNSGPNQEVKIIEHEAESDEDLNGVDIDQEVTNLAVNQMRYTIGAKMLQKKMEFLNKAIKGR
jgi:flagellar basal-body rod protein FlgB